jgi:phosphatidylglycerol lysyltransferase
MKRFFRNPGALIGIVLFVLALRALTEALKGNNYHEIVALVRHLPSQRVLLGMMLSALSYLVLTGYDALALVYVKQKLQYRKTAFASFLGYSFSNTIGLSFLTGGSVRFRLYSSWGLSALDISKVIVFCSATLWLGFCALAGLLFSSVAIPLPESIHVSRQALQLLGYVLLCITGTYVLLCVLLRKPLTIKGFEFQLPPLKIALAQVLLSLMDWTLAGSVLYVLLPPAEGFTFASFLPLFLFAQIAGVISQVPGGLGVFESVSVILFSQIFPASLALGSLLAFRAIYYLIPLAIATLMLAVEEALERKEKLKKIAELFGQWTPLLTPTILSITTFISGALLLFSGALPMHRPRLHWLIQFLPLPVVEFSHFLGSLIGMVLLLLAWGLQRRLDAAYHLTVLFLGTGIAVSLLKGFNYEEALVLFLMLVALIPCKSHFYRKSPLTAQAFTIQWGAAIIIVLMCTAWLGHFAYRHVEYSHELFWHFSIKGDAPRFLRASVGVIALILFMTLYRLFRPMPPEHEECGSAGVEKAAPIITSSARTYPNIGFLGDKCFLFSETGNSFIMYGIHGRSWIALGDPVGAEEEKEELIWQYRELVDRHDGLTVFYDVCRENLHLYMDLGLTMQKIGEDALVDLSSFTLEGGSHKKLRNLVNKMRKEGCAFDIIEPAQLDPYLAEMKEVSDAWLSGKNTRERKFTMGCFSEAYLRHFSTAIVKRDEQIIAFANIWSGARKEELSIDLMRYLPDESLEGSMEYLFIELMAWGAQAGYRWFSLGMAPLSGLEDRLLSPLRSRIGAMIYRYGDHFYNFQGLRQYKEKFDPRWEPKYIAFPGIITLPPILSDMAFLTAGGVRGMISR